MPSVATAGQLAERTRQEANLPPPGVDPSTGTYTHAGARPLYDPMTAGDKFADLVADLPVVGRLLPEGGVAKDVVRTVGSTASSFTSTPRDILLSLGFTILPQSATAPIVEPAKAALKSVFPGTASLLTRPIGRPTPPTVETAAKAATPVSASPTKPAPPGAPTTPPPPVTGQPVVRSPQPVPAAASVGDDLGRTGPPTPPTIGTDDFELPIRGGSPETPPPLPKYAGSINLERINASDDVKRMIDQTAKTFEEQITAARRGVIPHAETQRMADQLGMTADELLQRPVGAAFNDAQGLAVRRINAASAANVVDEAAKFARGEISRDQFKAAWARHAMIQAQESGIATEAGRALSARRIFVSPEEFKARTLKEIADRLPGGDLTDLIADRLARLDVTDVAAVNQFLRSVSQATKWDMIYEAWLSALLSGPQTHAANIVSNAVAVASGAVERSTAGVIESARARILRVPKERFVGEGPAALYGSVAGLREGVRKGVQAFLTELPSQSMTKIDTRVMQAIPGKTGKAIRIPLRALTAADEFFKAVNYSAAIHGAAYRKAAMQGLKGKALIARVAELAASPGSLPPALVKGAEAEMLYRTFQQPLGPVGQTLYRLREQTVVGKVIAPFLRTPVNVAKFGLERTPLNAFRLMAKQWQGTLRGPAVSDEWAKVAIGSAIAAGTATYALEGRISGGGSKSAGERAALQRTGWQPYSVRIGDTWYSYGRIEPLGMIIGATADFVELTDQMTEAERAHAASKISLAIANNLTSKTFLRGVSDVLNAITDPERYGERWVNSLAGTIVPTGVAVVARATDPTVREVHSTLEAIRARIPIASTELEPKLDLWGNPIQRAGSTGSRLISPVMGSPVNPDPVDAELVRLGLAFVPPRPRLTIQGLAVDLEPKDATMYRRAAGVIARGRVEAILKSPTYERLSDDLRRDQLKRAVQQAHEEARLSMLVVLARRPGGTPLFRTNPSKPAGR